MPLGQSQDIPQADPRGMATPRFWHHLIGFRHVISGSLALASLNHTCRNLVPTFPQRSPPSLLTTAACGGLRSTPDCRPRRALLHLSYSYAPPCGPALLVTQCQLATQGLGLTISRPSSNAVPPPYRHLLLTVAWGRGGLHEKNICHCVDSNRTCTGEGDCSGTCRRCRTGGLVGCRGVRTCWGGRRRCSRLYNRTRHRQLVGA